VAIGDQPGDVVGRVLDTVWRMESPKLIAALTRIVRDVGRAEDFAQDAMVAAVQQWPDSGVPDNPAAWLMAVGKRRAIDHVRRAVTLDRKEVELGLDLELQQETPADVDEAIDNAAIADDLLRLVFICCHPVLSVEARLALTLRMLGGLRTDEIARAFLVSESTIAQRIVRAKRTLAEARVPFEVPTGADFDGRLASVLQVVYLVFNEGYSATAGDDWIRPSLCEDALRLARVLATLVPDEPEVHGLVALLELQASRTRARVRPGGEPIPLAEQNRARWDQLLIGRGLASLTRAEALGGARGPYALQAAIVAVHASARRSADTDWPQIVALYDALAELTPSPIIELNRAVAVSMAFGPAAGLELVDALREDPALAMYHLVPAVRGDLLAKVGRYAEASAELARAADMTRNLPERNLLMYRAAAARRGQGDHSGMSGAKPRGEPSGSGQA
jgi:RNA polymerase sigma factor (sigma-70 family)